jgi:hypothetical protein
MKVMTDTKDQLPPDSGQKGENALRWKNKTFTILYEQSGIFSYGKDAFAVLSPTGHKKYLYSEIEVIVAFKVKGRQGDELRVEIIFNDCAIRISQDAPGWHQFVIKTKEVFPTIPDQWDLEMLIPSFAIDLMVLYKKPEV